eukprot:gene28573-35456_t
MSLQEQFDQAMADSKNLPERPDNMTLLKIYALFKQGSAGDVEGARPGFTDMVGRAKYDAWAALKGTSQDEAKQQTLDRCPASRKIKSPLQAGFLHYALAAPKILAIFSVALLWITGAKAPNRKPSLMNISALCLVSVRVPFTPLRSKRSTSPSHSYARSNSSASFSATFCAASRAFFGVRLCS